MQDILIVPASRLLIVPLLVVGLVLANGGARAEETPAGTSLSAAEVSRLSDEGFAFYKKKDYRHASEKFLQAYAFVEDPNLLFNIARCYEALGDLDGAIEKYESFAAKPDADPQGRRRAVEAVRALRQSKTLASQAGDASTSPSTGTTPTRSPAFDASRRARAVAVVPAWREPRTPVPAAVVAAPADMPRARHHESGNSSGRAVTGWVATGLLVAGASVTGILAVESSNKLKASREAFPGDGPAISAQASRTTVLTLSTDGLALAAAVMAGVSLYWSIGGPSSSSELTASIGPGSFRIAGSF